ncbi:MAG TPA: Gfo/Idh/MocA family oxidoreductase, partial [Vicinamibacteria bacterium]|nr:Gfo/Idh/MocA family oxidoreductase [Vicinamibacteria bacterium]
MGTHGYSRRTFMARGAGAAGAIVAAKTVVLRDDRLEAAPNLAVAPSDRVRFGIVGVGMQGSSLLTSAIDLPGVECVAACDLYDGRHTLAREIAGETLRTTRRYQELLEDKGIDCLIAAVPDHWHRRLVVEAVRAGKDVYCEKPMSHSAADGIAMVSAAKETGR